MDLELRTPLERSVLWRWQESFYREQGARAWASGTVPWRITSTPLIARAFAEVLGAYRGDLVSQGLAAATAPLCVLDLGAGTGRLAFLLCRELEARQVPFRYVMTDVAPANVAAWRAHPQLAPFFSRGVLDVAEAPAAASSLSLQVSGEHWCPGALPGPLAAIATYLFDTLESAAWRKGLRSSNAYPVHPERRGALDSARAERMRTGSANSVSGPKRGPVLERGLVTLRAPTASSSLADVTWDFDFEPAAADDFVRAYAEGLNHGPFLVPVGALECLSALRRLGAGRALTLMVDKGPSTLEQLAHAPFPGLARHGCVSALVNFHSIKAWAEDGQWLAPRAPDADLGTFALADGASPAQVSGTRAAFDAALGDGPLLAALALVDEVAGRDAPPALELLEALAATNFSPDAAMRLAGALRAVAPGLDPELLPTLVAALDAVWKNHFEFGEEIDLAFELATVLHRAGQLSHAARFYEASVAGRGAHATTCFNLALCHLDLGKREQARACLERVVALAPEHDRAKALLAALGP